MYFPTIDLINSEYSSRRTSVTILEEASAIIVRSKIFLRIIEIFSNFILMFSTDLI